MVTEIHFGEFYIVTLRKFGKQAILGMILLELS